MKLEESQTARAHVDLVEDYFDAHSREWSDLYATVREVNDLVLLNRKAIAIDFLCRELEPSPLVRVLDAGCGAGLASLDVARKGFYVQGFDVSDGMLDQCRRRFSAEGVPADRYSFMRADLLDSDFPAASFDGVLALGFLQYLPDEHQALLALNRLLSSGGILVVSGPTKAKISNYFGVLRLIKNVKRALRGSYPFRLLKKAKDALLGRRQTESNSHRVLRDISRHTYSPGRFEKLLREAGFEIVRWQGHGFAGFPFLKRLLGFRGELFLHRFLSRLASFLPIGRWANDIVVLAKKRN